MEKCQDSGGAWRIGVRVTAVNLSPGDSLCNFFTMNGFPSYSKDPTIGSHCPFEDDYDSFIPYDPSDSSYTGNFAAVMFDLSFRTLD